MEPVNLSLYQVQQNIMQEAEAEVGVVLEGQVVADVKNQRICVQIMEMQIPAVVEEERILIKKPAAQADPVL